LSHLLLSLPLTRLHPSPYSAGPVFVSHYYDIQSAQIPSAYLDKVFTSTIQQGEKKAHVGAPGSNVEVKLVGEGVEGAEEGGEKSGRVWVRGPAIGERLGVEGKNG
jgi:long-chain acyl-CoA synthetase